MGGDPITTYYITGMIFNGPFWFDYKDSRITKHTPEVNDFLTWFVTRAIHGKQKLYTTTINIY